MSFRKRNAVIGVAGPTPASASASASAARQDKILSPGTRPSPHDGRLTTSTGTASLDQLLASHAGLPLGTSLLIEEMGTTDFGGILGRYFAAEGLVQGHHAHVLGPGESWRRELPGLSSDEGAKKSEAQTAESKMKIAWRYEALNSRKTPASSAGAGAFRHSFDLSKRLEDGDIKGQLHFHSTMDVHAQQPRHTATATTTTTTTTTMFQRFIQDVTASLETTPPSSVHRVIVPGLLSPTLYLSSASHPQQVLQFLHALRGLLRRFPSRLAVLATMPLSLYPRSTGLTRRMELLFDGVMEMVPLPHEVHVGPSQGGEGKQQGLMRTHSLPIFHDKGGGLDGSWVKEDMSFKLSTSSGLVITPFSLPPVLGEGEDAASNTKDEKEKKKKNLDF